MIVAPVTFAVGEAVKKIKIKGKNVPGWVAGLLAAPVGVLVMFLLANFHFTNIGILTGILAGLSTAGIYGTMSAAIASKPKEPTV